MKALEFTTLLYTLFIKLALIVIDLWEQFSLTWDTKPSETYEGICLLRVSGTFEPGNVPKPYVPHKEIRHQFIVHSIVTWWLEHFYDWYRIKTSHRISENKVLLTLIPTVVVRSEHLPRPGILNHWPFRPESLGFNH